MTNDATPPTATPSADQVEAELRVAYGLDRARQFQEAAVKILASEPPLSQETKFLEEYKVLVELHVFANRAFWDKNNYFVAMNLGFLAAWTLLVSDNMTALTKSASLIMAVAAAIYCILWFFVVGRARAYIRYWDHRTFEIEKQLKTFNTFTGFLDFARSQRFGFVSSSTIGLFIPVCLFVGKRSGVTRRVAVADGREGV